MNQELDKLFLLLQKACAALARTHKLFVMVSNPTESSIQSPEQTSVTKPKYIPMLEFELRVKDKKTSDWHSLGKFATGYTKNGEIALPGLIKTNQGGGDKLAQDIEGLNEDSKTILMAAYGFFNYARGQDK